MSATIGDDIGETTAATEQPKTVLLASPRGYCAGVDRAVVTVEKALDLYGAPVYVRKEIVHNAYVVQTLRIAARYLLRRPMRSPKVRWSYSAHTVFHPRSMRKPQRAISGPSMQRARS